MTHTFIGDHLRYAHDVLTLTSDGTIQRSEQGRTASHTVTSSRLMSWVGRAPTNPRQPGTDRSRIEATAANLQALEADSRMDDEKRKRGDFSLYLYYLSSTGLILILPWLLQMAMTALSDRVPSKYHDEIGAGYANACLSLQALFSESGWVEILPTPCTSLHTLFPVLDY